MLQTQVDASSGPGLLAPAMIAALKSLYYGAFRRISEGLIAASLPQHQPKSHALPSAPNGNQRNG